MSTPTTQSGFGAFIIRHRWPVLAIAILITLLFGYFMRYVTLKTPTIDLFPKNHPYVQTYVQYEDTFGGANVVVLTLEVKDGTIYNTQTLEKLQKVTKSLELLPAVNNYSVLSLSQRKIKITTVDEVQGFRSDPVMWPGVPQTEEELDALRTKIYASGRYHGNLVSSDDKSLMIVAGFFERGVQSAADTLEDIVRRMATAEGRDVEEAVATLRRVSETEIWKPNDTLFDAIDKLCRSVEDENHQMRMIGRPIMLGWINREFPSLVKIFFATVAAIVICLFLYFRAFVGVLIPTMTAVASAIWGLGFLGLMAFLQARGIDPFKLGDYHFNPLVIVVPFIISARALSHSVQLIERYMEELERTGHRQDAAVFTFHGLSKPGIVSIVTDAAGVFIVAITPIPLMQKLALTCGFWILSIIVTDMILNPVLLTIIPPPKRKAEGEGKSLLNHVLTWMTHASTQRHQKTILVVTVVVFAIGLWFARGLKIGDVHPGTPMLWPDSQYNIDTAAIGERFGKTEILTIVVEGAERDQIKSPQILLTMEKFQRELEAMDEVSYTASIADLVPDIVRIMHGSHPKWGLIPENLFDSGFYLGMIFSGAEPGDLDRFIDRKMQNANISVYLSDHKGETLRAVIARAKQFIADNPLENAQFRLAGNMGGLLAAVNESIVRSELKVTILAFAFVFVVCVIAYRSFWAGVYFLIPIAISNYLTYALMGVLGIGLDVNSLPVVALGVGLGVDYGLYVVGRIEEAYSRTGDIVEATGYAMRTAGRAVFFTATTMVLGIIFWAFSFLRFQAEMGMLLAFWMVISMLGGLILLPTLIVTFKPKFVTHRGPARS